MSSLMINMKPIHTLGMILIAILTILDIVTRGLPITWANITPLNAMFIVAIILYVLDVATKGKYITGKYRSRPLALIALAIGLLMGIIYVLVFSNF